MAKFIKSSSRTKPDPIYYRDKANRWIRQRDELFVVIEMEEGTTGKEAKALRVQVERLSAKIRWAMTQIVVAQGMRLLQEESARG